MNIPFVVMSLSKLLLEFGRQPGSALNLSVAGDGFAWSVEKCRIPEAARMDLANW
jgi:hypothetical protein